MNDLEIKKLITWVEKAKSTIYAEGDDTFHIPLIDLMIKKYIDPLNLPKDFNILDLGCGAGRFMEQMRNRGYNNLYGVTLSAEDVESCHKKGLQVYAQDISFLDFSDNSFEFIFCRNSLEHSPFPYFTLLEMTRVLKPKGLIYLEVPVPNSDKFQENNPNHYSVFGNQMWLSLFYKVFLKMIDGEILTFYLDEKNNFVEETNLCKKFKEQTYVYILTKEQ